MPPIEIGPKGLQAPRALGPVETRKLREQVGNSAPASTGDSAPVAARRSDALDPGQPPVDNERVATIRKAIETGQYPVIPMRVADAMIAAGYLLRSGK